MLALALSVKPLSAGCDAFKNHSRLGAPRSEGALGFSVKQHRNILHHGAEQWPDGAFEGAHPAAVATSARAFDLTATVASGGSPSDAGVTHSRAPQFSVGRSEYFMNPLGKPMFSRCRPATAED